MAQIQPTQIKRIHALTGALQMPDDGYRALLLEGYRVDSSKRLSQYQANHLIGVLEEQAIKAGVWKSPAALAADKPDDRQGQMRTSGKKYDELWSRDREFATPRQLRMIEAIWAEVSRASAAERGKALDKLLYSKLGVVGILALSAKDVGKVLRILEAMKKSASAVKMKANGRK